MLSIAISRLSLEFVTKMQPSALVCMIGFDYQRILDGIKYWYARQGIQRTYLLYDKKKDKYGYASTHNARELEKDLKLFDPQLIGYNPQSYEDTFVTLYGIINREVAGNGNRLLIDATSGTKEAYGASITIALMFDGASVYIVPPSKRGSDVPEHDQETCPACNGSGRLSFDEWFNEKREIGGLSPQVIHLPGSRLERPTMEEALVLTRLEEHKGQAESIKSLITWCGENPFDSAIKNRFSRMISKLCDAGFLEEEVGSKLKPLSLTEFGRIFSKALKAHQSGAKKSDIRLEEKASSPFLEKNAVTT